MTNAARPLSNPSAPRPMADAELATLIASRLLHDLSNPVGALWNGVEFSKGDADAEGRAHAARIIEESAKRLRAKVEFLRTAFGARGGRAEPTDLREPRDLLRGYVEGGRVTLDWEPDAREIPRPAARLLLVLALLGAEAMPLGGVLRVGVVDKPTADGRTELNLVVVADGRAPRLNDMVAALLRDGAPSDDAEPLMAKHAPAIFANRLAADLGARLNFGVEDGRVIFAAAL